MSTFQSQAQNHHRKIVLTCILGAILTPFLIVVGCYAGFRVSNSRAVHRLEAKVRQKGEPVTLAELAAKRPSVPAESNAAVAILNLWAEDEPAFWQAFLLGERSLPGRSEHRTDPAVPFLGAGATRISRVARLSSTNRIAAEAFLAERAEHLNAMRLALTRPHCIFPVRIADGQAALLPYLAPMKQEAQSFRVVGLLALEHRDGDAAIAALEDIVRTGQALTEDPFLISQLVRIACLSMAVDDAQRLLSRQRLSAAQLDRLQAVLERAQAKGALHLALISGRALDLSMFDPPAAMLDQMSAGSGSGSSPEDLESTRIGLKVMGAIGLASVDRRFMLEFFEEAIALADEDSPAALERYDKLFVRVDKEARQFPPKIVSAMLLPALARDQNRFAGFEARRRAALTAIALERYRLSHADRLPDTLAELVPTCLAQLPADPFDGQPLRFARLQPGYVVYSIGADRKDDGGKERPQKGPATNYDETFTVER